MIAKAAVAIGLNMISSTPYLPGIEFRDLTSSQNHLWLP
jgi:hypothetical protein